VYKTYLRQKYILRFSNSVKIGITTIKIVS